MSSLVKHDVSALLNENSKLKRENADLRKELLKQQSHIKNLQDVSLTIAERQALLGIRTEQGFS